MEIYFSVCADARAVLRRSNIHKPSEQPKNKIPVTVPDTTVPFFSSIVTDSLLSFIKNLDRRRRETMHHQKKLSYHKAWQSQGLLYLTSFIVKVDVSERNY